MKLIFAVTVLGLVLVIFTALVLLAVVAFSLVVTCIVVGTEDPLHVFAWKLW